MRCFHPRQRRARLTDTHRRLARILRHGAHRLQAHRAHHRRTHTRPQAGPAYPSSLQQPEDVARGHSPRSAAKVPSVVPRRARLPLQPAQHADGGFSDPAWHLLSENSARTAEIKATGVNQVSISHPFITNSHPFCPASSPNRRKFAGTLPSCRASPRAISYISLHYCPNVS
jgi:hypothetical protein